MIQKFVAALVLLLPFLFCNCSKETPVTARVDYENYWTPEKFSVSGDYNGSKGAVLEKDSSGQYVLIIADKSTQSTFTSTFPLGTNNVAIQTYDHNFSGKQAVVAYSSSSYSASNYFVTITSVANGRANGEFFFHGPRLTYTVYSPSMSQIKGTFSAVKVVP